MQHDSFRLQRLGEAAPLQNDHENPFELGWKPRPLVFSPLAIILAATIIFLVFDPAAFLRIFAVQSVFFGVFVTFGFLAERRIRAGSIRIDGNGIEIKSGFTTDRFSWRSIADASVISPRNRLLRLVDRLRLRPDARFVQLRFHRPLKLGVRGWGTDISGLSVAFVRRAAFPVVNAASFLDEVRSHLRSSEGS